MIPVFDKAKESGRRVKNAAKAQKLTQEELAKQSQMSVSKLRKIYNGERPLKEYDADRLSYILDVRTEYLLCVDNFKTDEEREESELQKTFEDASFRERVINLLISKSIAGQDLEFINCVQFDDEYYQFKYKQKDVFISSHDISTWLKDCSKYASFLLLTLIKEQSPETSS